MTSMMEARPRGLRVAELMARGRRAGHTQAVRGDEAFAKVHSERVGR